jgi:hypothetical protein
MTKGRFPDPDFPAIPEFDRLHMRVLSGYCVDPNRPATSSLRNWVYVYDPETGPRAETFNSWSNHADGTWVAPPVASGPYLDINYDPPTVWNDSDCNGIADFDQLRRIPPLPDCPTPP